MQTLDDFVRSHTPDNLVHLVPVIEKEVIQYDVFEALDSLGLIDKLVFHGGTCLRLCYGAQRRSEDLDFACTDDFEKIDLHDLQNYLQSKLGKRFGLEVHLKTPSNIVKFSHAKMQRWWIVVDTAPARPDLPSQKLKIEITSVETLTNKVCRVQRNYPFLPQSAGMRLVRCETREEIMADKLVAFVNTNETYLRKRDLWDLLYLISTDEVNVKEALSMVPFKKSIYACNLDNQSFAEKGIQRTNEVGMSRLFDKEMMRFMPKDAFEALLGSDIKRNYGINQVVDLYKACIRG